MATHLYCWRCNTTIPMLTEDEWQQMEPVLSHAIREVQDYRNAHGVSLGEAMNQGYGQAALRLYLELTGYQETNPDAIWHHRVSMYGPACQACGKPLRTPEASFCAACGARA
jgi:hypothetical protein